MLFSHGNVLDERVSDSHEAGPSLLVIIVFLVTPVTILLVSPIALATFVALLVHTLGLG